MLNPSGKHAYTEPTLFTMAEDEIAKVQPAFRAFQPADTPSPRACVFSLENAVCKDSYRRQCREWPA